MWTCSSGQGRTSPLNLLIDDRLPRAFPGGTGGVKNIGNYSPVSLYTSAQIIMEVSFLFIYSFGLEFRV